MMGEAAPSRLRAAFVASMTRRTRPLVIKAIASLTLTCRVQGAVRDLGVAVAQHQENVVWRKASFPGHERGVPVERNPRKRNGLLVLRGCYDSIDRSVERSLDRGPREGERRSPAVGTDLAQCNVGCLCKLGVENNDLLPFEF
jgi:hypothetical protein